MSSRSPSWLLVALALGCAATPSVTVKSSAAELTQKRSQDEPACDVTLDMTLPGPKGDPVIASEQVCLKKKDGPLVIPQRVQLALHNPFYCENEDTTKVEDGTAQCVWNHHFRDEYPFNFTIATRSNEIPLSRYVQLIRVYRNGTLVYSWNGAADQDETLPDRAERGVTIDGNKLRASLMPHLAGFELRIIPVDVSVDEAVLNAKVAERTNPFKRQLTTVLNAVEADPAFKPIKLEWACFASKMHQLSRRASRLSGGADGDAAPADLLKLITGTNVEAFAY